MTAPAKERGGRLTLYRNRDGALLTENQLPYKHGSHAASRAEYEPVQFVPLAALEAEIEWLRRTADSIEKKATELAGSLAGFRGEPALLGLAADRRNCAARLSALLKGRDNG